jgi:hypothetical protein
MKHRNIRKILSEIMIAKKDPWGQELFSDGRKIGGRTSDRISLLSPGRNSLTKKRLTGRYLYHSPHPWGWPGSKR